MIDRKQTLNMPGILNGATALLAVLAMIFLSIPAWSADGSVTTGPVIKDYGPVFETDHQFNLLPGEDYKVVFDLSNSPEDMGTLNRSIESVARFLNMHAQNGINPEDLEVAVVVHGSAGKDMLNDAAYQSRFDISNPNTGLLTALKDAGVQIWLCGQTAGSRGFGKDELHPSVGMALSAMTVLTRLQNEGWAFLPW